MHATIDDNHLKDLMKTALMELLEEHPAMLRGLMAEALEDMSAETTRASAKQEREDDYEEEELLRESSRRAGTRSRRSHGGSDLGNEGVSGNPRSARKIGSSNSPGFSTPGMEGLGTARGWDTSDRPSAEESSSSSVASDYETVFGNDPFFKKPAPSSGAAYGNATSPPPFPNHPGSATLAANSPVTGAMYLSRGLTLLVHPSLRGYVLLPTVISVLLFSIAVWWGMSEFGAFNGWARGYLPFWLSWIEWLLWPFFTITPVMMVFYLFTLLANLIAAPFNALLAEKVSRHINGLPLGGGPGFGTALLRLPGSIKKEWRKLTWFLVRAGLLVALFFVPLANLTAPFLWALFSAWSLGLKYLDYLVGNQGLDFDETRALATEKRWLVLGFGFAVLVMSIIPLLNFIAMPVAVAGASALWTERLAIRRNITV